ncbi:hypothetical protein ASG01_11600 [Chryseobacterium sp. Leaf180]|uniref:RNA polymerase sigma factor n=1 Tax=Chryseobacterium sp. Leaf180 TaxID=1736289 RepID=UPI0006F282B7|nr:sigma-70 family RNA polymerase sigma factor [Chryseobacterium sp. Leaf180]KQR92551.1 hypothetical protein ASG01_11600 [Chryseobacterium sp. Leaf180]
MILQNWQKIYIDYFPKLLGICRRYITDLSTAEDIVQDSFIAALQKENQLKNNEAIFAWLKKIVINNALQHIRKTQNSKVISTESENIPDTYTEMAYTNIDEQKHILSYHFTREQLLQSIDSLPSPQRSVFNLYFIDQKSHAQIAKLLEIPVNTSKSHLLRAKKSLQIYLKTHFVNNESKKNRGALLFVFFGLSNFVWAKTYGSSFADFTIKPQKNLIISDRDFRKDFKFPSSQKLFKKQIIAGGVFLLLIISFFIFFKPSYSGKATGNQFLKKSKIIKSSEEEIKTSDQKVSIIQNIANEDILKGKSVKNSVPVKQTEITVKKKSVDSHDNEDEPVIVVKKIIQRDTVFIER